MVRPLDAVLERVLHIVAQVIEAELVVGPIGDIRLVCRPAFRFGHVVPDHTDAQAQKLVDRSHPFGITPGQIVIHRDHVNTVTGQGVEVDSKSGDQGFPFPGLHLSNFALMKDFTTDELHVEMTHTQGTSTRFANCGKGFGENIVKRFALFQTGFEFGGLRFQISIRELGDTPLQLIDASHQGLNPFQLSLVMTPDDLGQNRVEHGP